MAEPAILTIDLGTSGPKASVVGRNGKVLGSDRGSLDIIWLEDGGAEQDPRDVWRTTLDASKAALASAGVPNSSIAAVIVSSQFSSMIPIDSAGEPVANMILWLDQRGAPKRLKRLKGFPSRGDSPQAMARWLQIHGLPPVDGAMTLNHMRYFKYANPELYEKTSKFLEPADYLTMKFSGAVTTSQCTSVMMLMTDNRLIGSNEWSAPLVEASMIDRSKLPDMVPTGSQVGTLLPAVAEELGLSASVPVLSGINDTQAGAIAAGAFQGTHAGLALGTSGVITTHLTKKKIDPLKSLFTIPSPLGSCHLLSGENGVAGVAVDNFLDTVVYPEDPFCTHDISVDRYVAFNEAASSSPRGANGVIFLPWLKGAMAPQSEPRMRGGFLNLSLETTRSDMARALMEGVAMNMRWLQSPVEKFIKRDISHYVFYGGGAQSDLWAQMMADTLEKPIHQLAQPGFANSLGTAMFGFERLGEISESEIAQLVEISNVYEPDRSASAQLGEQFELFKTAFKQTRSIYKALNGIKAK